MNRKGTRENSILQGKMRATLEEMGDLIFEYPAGLFFSYLYPHQGTL